jgi:hypothetical protein
MYSSACLQATRWKKNPNPAARCLGPMRSCAQQCLSGRSAPFLFLLGVLQHIVRPQISLHPRPIGVAKSVRRNINADCRPGRSAGVAGADRVDFGTRPVDDVRSVPDRGRHYTPIAQGFWHAHAWGLWRACRQGRPRSIINFPDQLTQDSCPACRHCRSCAREKANAARGVSS